MNPLIRVRPARPEDAETLAGLNPFVHDLHVSARPDVFRTPSPAEHAELVTDFRTFLTSDDALAFVAEEGRPVGYVTATIHRRPQDALRRERAFVFVEQIAVDPEATRAGAGKALVEAVRAAGRKAGCTTLITDVWAFNATALAFFEGVGLTPMRHWLEQGL